MICNIDIYTFLVYINFVEKFKSFDFNGIIVDLCILSKNYKENKYIILALHNKKQVGYCDFALENSECKISRIVITDKSFLKKGIGSCMFKAMEFFAFKNGITYISGIFFPRGYDDARETTSTFYQRHGMKDSFGGYDYCEREEISKQITSAEQQFEIPVIYNAEIYQRVIDFNYKTNDFFETKNKDIDTKQLDFIL